MVMRPSLPPPNFNFMRGQRMPPPHWVPPPLNQPHFGSPPGRCPSPMPPHRLRGPPPPPPGPMRMPMRFRPRPPQSPLGSQPYAMPPFSPKRMIRPIGPSRPPVPNPPRREVKNPPKSQHHCDNCERFFFDANQLAKHLEEHEICGLDGCKYTAHSKLVAIHITNVHRTGLYKKMTEDFGNYCGERKKNFPTLEKLESSKKVKEEHGKDGKDKKETFDRRERHDSRKKHFENINKRTEPYRRNQKSRKKNNFQPRNHNETNIEKDIKEEPSIETDIVWNGDCPGFRGTEYYRYQESLESTEDICDSNKFSDDEYLLEESQPKVAINVLESVSSSSLGSIIIDYGSDSDDDAPSEEPAIVVKNDVDNSSKTLPVSESPSKSINTENDSSSKALPVSESPSKSINTENDSSSKALPVSESHSKSINTENDSKKLKKRKNEIPIEKRIIRPRKLTLLQTLTQREKLHEKNVILQCVRYIIRQEYPPPESK